MEKPVSVPAPAARTPVETAIAPPPAPAVALAPAAPVAIPAQPASPTAPITLLLPLDSPDFGAAADAVKQGFMAAQAASPDKPRVAVRATNADPEKIVAAYDAAVAAGTRVVVGPLTRDAVTALAAANRSGVPTLALNQADTSARLPPQFYTFGLALDAESRMVARAAWSMNLRIAAVVGTPTALSKRCREAFVDEWQRLGGQVSGVYEAGAGAEFGTLRSALAKTQHEVVFLAAEPDAIRIIRPYLGAAAAVFTTSQINGGRTDRAAYLDLEGVRFVDMPWIMQPEKFTDYARPQGLPGDLDRFYALGIDAFHIAAELAAGHDAFSLDGVTGRIAASSNGAIERRPVLAVYKQGLRVPLE